ncbi:hypothetical protein IFO70_34260 [Phormidium tenue FACHB-886]|nr:hypothetical protein [Phormidium tenue FACHB-886]
MGKIRLDAYLNLIQGLLHTPSNCKRDEILRDNSELINLQLIEVIDQVIAALAEKGNNKVVADLLSFNKDLSRQVNTQVP